jgi:hypothetical protein
MDHFTGRQPEQSPVGAFVDSKPSFTQFRTVFEGNRINLHFSSEISIEIRQSME